MSLFGNLFKRPRSQIIAGASAGVAAAAISTIALTGGLGLTGSTGPAAPPPARPGHSIITTTPSPKGSATPSSSSATPPPTAEAGHDMYFGVATQGGKSVVTQNGVPMGENGPEAYITIKNAIEQHVQAHGTINKLYINVDDGVGPGSGSADGCSNLNASRLITMLEDLQQGLNPPGSPDNGIYITKEVIIGGCTSNPLSFNQGEYVNRILHASITTTPETVFPGSGVTGEHATVKPPQLPEDPAQTNLYITPQGSSLKVFGTSVPAGGVNLGSNTGGVATADALAGYLKGVEQTKGTVSTVFMSMDVGQNSKPGFMGQQPVCADPAKFMDVLRQMQAQLPQPIARDVELGGCTLPDKAKADVVATDAAKILHTSVTVKTLVPNTSPNGGFTPVTVTVKVPTRG